MRGQQVAEGGEVIIIHTYGSRLAQQLPGSTTNEGIPGVQGFEHALQEPQSEPCSKVGGTKASSTEGGVQQHPRGGAGEPEGRSEGSIRGTLQGGKVSRIGWDRLIHIVELGYGIVEDNAKGKAVGGV